MPKDTTLRLARQAAELLGSEAFRAVFELQEQSLKDGWANADKSETREAIWFNLQAWYALKGQLEAAVQAPILEEQTERRLGFDQRI